jgi:hypothetical protein
MASITSYPWLLCWCVIIEVSAVSGNIVTTLLINVLGSIFYRRIAVSLTAGLVKLLDDVWQILTSTEVLPHATDKILAEGPGHVITLPPP